MAPADRRPERPLSFRCVPQAGRQQFRAAEAFEDLLRPHHLHPRRGELDRERQPVEAPADLGHVLVRLERTGELAGPRREQSHGVFRSERRDDVFLLGAERKALP